MRRVISLTLLLARRSLFRPVALSLLVAVAVVVFALVSELSRVSQQGLDQAILQDIGLEGAYEVGFLPESGADVASTYSLMERLAPQLEVSIWGVREVFPEIHAECPPFDQLGDLQPRVLWERPGVGQDLPYGQDTEFETRWCVQGQEVPGSAVFVPNYEQASVYGSVLYVNPEYRELLYLSTLGPISVSAIVTSEADGDLQNVIREAVLSEVAHEAALYGIDPQGMFTVKKFGQDAANITAAAAGIGTVYDFIRWGVLVLAAIALATVQALVVRQRSWFYGLMTAIGASKRRIIALLSFDTLLVTLVGLVISGTVLVAVSDTLREFSITTFQVEMKIGSGAMIPSLLAGIAVSSVIAILVPVYIVSKRDPYAVLEAARD